MSAALRELLGESQILSAAEKATAKEIHPAWAGDLKVEEVFIPSEDHILIPAIVIHPPKDRKLTGVEICLSSGGRSVAEKDPQPYLERARKGAMVVLPDLRFSGDYSVERLAGHVRRGNVAISSSVFGGHWCESR